MMRLLLWLVSATATDRRRLSARDRQTTKGLLPNDVERTPQRWVFVHVPKAAGASFMIDSRHFLTRRDTITGSEEKGAFSRTTLRKLENGGMRTEEVKRGRKACLGTSLQLSIDGDAKAPCMRCQYGAMPP